MSKNIQIKQENVLNAYKNASKEQKELLEHLFGSEVFKPKDVRERIKTFHDAYCELGNEHPFVKSYEKYVNTASGEEADVISYLKLRIIAAALNEGWKPQFTEDEYRYYPWFYLLTEEEISEKSEEWKKEHSLWLFGGNSGCGASCGLAYAGSVNAWSNSLSLFSARLAVKSEELAVYFGKQFIDIWAGYVFNTEE